MTLFFICFCLLAAKMPFLFTRYFVVLQPMLTIILLIDFIIVANYISVEVSKKMKLFVRLVLGVVFLRLLFINIGEKLSFNKKYIYQITHQLKGPLDYIIPYIKENYAKTDDLVLATNYEELSYVFYLGCKVTIGYINKNIEEDLKYQPDIIVYRKKWGQDPVHYNNFIQKVPYSKIVFPVYDYPVNNIAEFYGNMEHQFKTLMAESEADKAEMFVRINR